ncbi:MAG TPA: LapA family protein [Acidimicrobiales bacterium]|nr:LapA family protein [Acidimicrobiales bacterium]
MVQQSPGDNKSSGGKLGGGAIVSIIGVALLVIFMIQNTEKIRIHYLAWHFSMMLWLFTLITAVIGAVVWFGLGVIRRHRRRVRRRDG